MSLPRIGDPVPRVEDARMLCGHGLYADDRSIPDPARAVLVRSPVAHARIVSIDVAAARALPGVLAVLTGKDWQRDRLGDIPCVSIPPTIMGGKWFRTPFPALQRDRVLCVGHAVAMVVAETQAQALDAAERVAVEYDILPAAATVEAALVPGAPPVWPEQPDNLCFVHEMGNRAQTEAAFAAASHVTTARIHNQRLAGNPLEARATIGSYGAGEARYRLVTSTANPHRIRQLLAEHVFRVPAHRIHVIAGDVGGGFGTKGGLYPEEALVFWAAKMLGRPVKWVSDRSEAFLSDFNGRDQVADARMALDRDGRIRGFEVALYHNLGCQVGPSGAHPPLTGARMLSGVYAIPAIHVRVHGVLSHTRSLTTYRGAGRPEAAFLVERMLDQAARELAIDPVELRRSNLIRPEQMPYKTALGEVYDSGEFEALLAAAQDLADWDGYERRQAASADRGLARGRGVSVYVEVCATVADRMEVRFDPTAGVSVLAGTFSYGQGHETVYAQMLGDWLGVAPETVRVVQGDTDKVAYGRGSFGSQSMTIGGSALKIAADQIIERGKRIAAQLLEADASDLVFDAGAFTVAGTDRAVALGDVAKASYGYGNRLPADLASGLEGVGYWIANPQNYPNGCHIIEVEVDPDTGSVRLGRVTAVDDFGVAINPLLLDGQVHGALAQGIGQAMMEEVLHDGDGQLITGSFMDYAIPRADQLPSFTLGTRNVATRGNLLGVKGGGETGTVGVPPAIVAAIVDALKPFGVETVAMPATPERVWQAIRSASRNRQTEA